MNKINFALGVAVVAIVLATFGYFHSSAPVRLTGGVTNYDEVDASAIKSGASGTRFGNFIFGFQSCVLIDGASVTATTSKAEDCAVTGVVTGDTIILSAPTTTLTGTGAGWIIQGASASSTNGFVTVDLLNLTGKAAVPASTATTTAILVIHPVTSVPGL